MENKTPEEIRESMQCWFEGIACSDHKSRTDKQEGWDKGILAAAEYVRRRLDYDEKISLELCKLLTGELHK